MIPDAIESGMFDSDLDGVADDPVPAWQGTRTPTEGADVLSAIAQARLLSGAQRAQYGGDGPMTRSTPPTPSIAMGGSDVLGICHAHDGCARA